MTDGDEPTVPEHLAEPAEPKPRQSRSRTLRWRLVVGAVLLAVLVGAGIGALMRNGASVSTPEDLAALLESKGFHCNGYLTPAQTYEKNGLSYQFTVCKGGLSGGVGDVGLAVYADEPAAAEAVANEPRGAGVGVTADNWIIVGPQNPDALADALGAEVVLAPRSSVSTPPSSP